MINPASAGGRLRAYLEFLAAILYFIFARSLALHGARGLVSSALSPLVEQAMLAFLLLMGYGAIGFWIDRQVHPINEQGLPRRPGWTHEAGMGLATGWAVALVCVLSLTMFGGIAISISARASSWGWFAADAAFFALTALAEEIAFRGYAFQRLAQAGGSLGAALGFAAICAILQSLVPGANRASIAVSIALTLVLSACYVRTRALWMSWGLNFGWKASRALLFGLAVNGVNSHSRVVLGDPMGSLSLSGGAFGLDGSWLAFFVLLAALPVVFRVTRDLNYRYNAPIVVPGGIPVDLDAIAHAQHDAAMEPPRSSASLVQIAQAAQAPATTSTAEEPPAPPSAS